MFISCCELPTDKQREGLCICFWPLLNISHWRKNPQRNHINFCVLTTWHTDPTTPNVPNVLQRSDHRRLPLDPCFGKICQLRHVPCREMTRHVDKREFQKANIQELYVIFFFLWGSCKEKGVGSATFFLFFFPRLISLNDTNDVCGLSGLLMVRGWGERRRDGRMEGRRAKWKIKATRTRRERPNKREHRMRWTSR